MICCVVLCCAVLCCALLCFAGSLFATAQHNNVHWNWYWCPSNCEYSESGAELEGVVTLPTRLDTAVVIMRYCKRAWVNTARQGKYITSRRREVTFLISHSSIHSITRGQQSP